MIPILCKDQNTKFFFNLKKNYLIYISFHFTIGVTICPKTMRLKYKFSLCKKEITNKILIKYTMKTSLVHFKPNIFKFLSSLSDSCCRIQKKSFEIVSETNHGIA